MAKKEVNTTAIPENMGDVLEEYEALRADVTAKEKRVKELNAHIKEKMLVRGATEIHTSTSGRQFSALINVAPRTSLDTEKVKSSFSPDILALLQVTTQVETLKVAQVFVK